jgi:pyrroline-5-carboxylate reductase
MTAGSAVRVGFIGAGKMATALAQGLISSGFTSSANVVASDVLPKARTEFQQATGAQTVGSGQDVFARADVVFLAVKPQQMSEVLAEAVRCATARHLVISIAAGIPLQTISAALGADKRLIRVMPNTPSLVAAGASAFALGGAATADDQRLVERMLSTVGIAICVPESQLDAVTGLSGSGPAYVFQIIEALSDGGVRVGLPRDVATRLAAQTVFGSAKLVLETGQHPAVLKDAVASPGGTTIAGLQVLEARGLRGSLIEAVEAATRRSRELAQSS